MRDELAGKLLDRLVDWTPEEQAQWVLDLRRMAAYKYDAYEGFVPGERFFESLARWLGQFDEQAARRLLLKFVREDLIFISREEINHAIACVYPDHIKYVLIGLAATDLGLPSHLVDRIAQSAEFRSLRRRTLYLGLSDGARLDRLRRSSPELSHEQFWLSPELGDEAIRTMAEKLEKAMVKHELVGHHRFEHVVLVDDFYGSGTSLLRQEKGGWAGKLFRAGLHLTKLQAPIDGVTEAPLLSADAGVTVVIYVASAQAEKHIGEMLAEFRPTWSLRVIQPLPADTVVTDEELVAISRWFFDPCLVNEHTKQAVPLGYMEAALPLVLHHNTPNNSISPLWADSTDRADEGLSRHALFRRYERHHQDRP